ncbi:type VII secretion protein EccE [Micromonospora sp. 4G57]|uniref:Type VII secretion protein EccE n=1 Tax=Micromonospora sicca TaxID=2202420 RepID=A0ABU5JEL8_9ACTN|nr:MULTISPECIES: type VII secretion protein EccE [unclassified Micromonospora]MDZ5445304.1 type VII secretion protein EccE [Micromonospora sp. 4G57]MDZ5491053.1 type VII secretion protein EccE [Micromonospora sp. 4G53]
MSHAIVTRGSAGGGAVTATRTVSPAPATARQPLPPQWRRTGGRTASGPRAGQVVAAQLAVAVLVAAVGRGAAVTAAALLLAALLLPTAWVRVHGRWLFEWLVVGLAYLTRRRALPPAAGPAALVDLVAPGAEVRSAELAGGPAAVVDDAAGLTALLEIGDPGDLLGDGRRTLPPPLSLLPVPSVDSPPVRIQLLLSAAPAPAPSVGAGTAGTSYRQLTDGRLAGRERAVLAVRVLRVDGWSNEELRRALSGTVRRIVRRLGPLTGRPLGEPAALRVLAELAHHDAGVPIRESWQTVGAGGLLQTTFRLRRWPDPRADAARRLVPRLLALPATATTVSLCIGPRAGADAAPVPAELSVRLAAWTAGELAAADRALRRLAADLGTEVRRLDGEQLGGLAATLPLASARAEGTVGGAALDALELGLGEAGLMVGANRHGGAVSVRLFRPEPTRLLLVGGVRAAQLVVLRALALGARVVVQTARPRAWEPFVRGAGAPGGAVPVIPPGRPVGGAPGSPVRPLLLVVDAGAASDGAQPGTAWQCTLVVRDGLTPAEVDALARADLAILQPLDPGEAALAGAALGLGGSAEWLTRIRDDMVAVVNRRALRWALLSPTPIESQLVGRAARR